MKLSNNMHCIKIISLFSSLILTYKNNSMYDLVILFYGFTIL